MHRSFDAFDASPTVAIDNFCRFDVDASFSMHSIRWSSIVSIH